MSNSFEYNRRERISVYVDILEAIETMIEQECYDQAIDTIEFIINPINRENARKEKSLLYYAMKNSKNDDELKANRRAYIDYMKNAII